MCLVVAHQVTLRAVFHQNLQQRSLLVQVEVVYLYQVGMWELLHHVDLSVDLVELEGVVLDFFEGVAFAWLIFGKINWTETTLAYELDDFYLLHLSLSIFINKMIDIINLY